MADNFYSRGGKIKTPGKLLHNDIPFHSCEVPVMVLHIPLVFFLA